MKNICYNCFAERESAGGLCPYCGFDLEENSKKYPVSLRAGAMLNGRYIVGRVLGQGGFGITYLALDTQLSAKVAIKEFMPGEIATRVAGTTISVFAGDKADDFAYGAERFLDEARTLAKFIGNPNIAGVSSYFNENDTSYFVMDYIEGISFKSYIANHGGKVSVEDALNVMIPVLNALTAVHREGFVHRDVTPDNIYITRDGAVKLLDFGSARYSIGDKSKSLDVILKVGYAPKEQYIRRGKQGSFTDVYSCAACFYAAITGFLPPESLERLDRDEIVLPSAVGIDIPPYLEYAIMKGLAVQAEERFQTAEEFLYAIESQQLPAQALPVPPVTAPAPRRKQLMIGGIAVAAIAVVVVIVSILNGGDKGPSVPAMNNQETRENAANTPLLKAEVPSITIAGEQYETTLTRLDLRSKGLTDVDIEPLKYMINLTSLDLRQNGITSLDPIAGLTRLKSLTLQENAIEDVSPLAGLTELQTLYLYKNPVTSVSPLRNLTNLTELNSSQTNIDDISALAGLTKLTRLEIDGTNITDLSPLSGLTKLQYFRMPSTIEATDLSALAGMTELIELNMNGGSGNTGSIKDISALANMRKLQHLSFRVGNVEDISALAGLTELKYLSLYGGVRISDLSPLANLTKLQELNLSGSGNSNSFIENLDALSEMTNLTTLNLQADGLENISGLTNLTKLQTVRIYGNNSYIQDLSPLRNLTKLRELSLPMAEQAQYDPIDITPLAGLVNLTYLQLDKNIQDLEPLRNLTKLTYLSINNGYGNTSRSGQTNLEPISGLTNLAELYIAPRDSVKNLNALKNLTNLRTLHVNGVGVQDISALRNLTKLQVFTIFDYEKNIADWSPADHIPSVTVY